MAWPDVGFGYTISSLFATLRSLFETGISMADCVSSGIIADFKNVMASVRAALVHPVLLDAVTLRVPAVAVVE